MQVAERAAIYAEASGEPLRGYAVATTVFGASLLGTVALAERRGRLPGRVSPWDVVLVGVATHKVSRLVTRARVTSFLRAPFTRRGRPAGHGEVDDVPRADSPTIGRLLVCPYCLSLWVASAFTLSVVLSPRPTRIVAAVFAADALSDALNVGYRSLIDAADD